MRLFAAAEGETLSRASVAQQVHNRQHRASSRAVDVLVSKLRRKLDPTGRVALIRSVRGKGYRFAPRSPASACEVAEKAGRMRQVG